MKKQNIGQIIALIFLTGSVVFTSCKKEEIAARQNPYIRFKFNGVQKEYKSEVSAGKSESNGIHGLFLGGYKDARQPQKEIFSIIAWHETPVTAGKTYRDPLKALTSDGNKLPQILLTYTAEDEKGYQSAGLFCDETGYFPLSTIIPSLKNMIVDSRVNITELTSTYVKGTFSGTVYEATKWTEAVKQVISDGEFLAEIQ